MPDRFTGSYVHALLKGEDHVVWVLALELVAHLIIFYFLFFIYQKTGNWLEISWIGQRLKEGKQLGFLDCSSSIDWQGHKVYPIKMSLGPHIRGCNQYNSIGFFVLRRWNAGLQPSKGCRWIWVNTDNAATLLSSWKRAAAQRTLHSLLFILQICENVNLS